MVTRIRAKARTYLYIDEWMKELGLNDEIVAERMGTSRVTVWRWRTQQNRLNPQKIAALAFALGREPEDLWRLPSRPSVDALLKGLPDDVAQKAVDVVSILVKTGT